MKFYSYVIDNQDELIKYIKTIINIHHPGIGNRTRHLSCKDNFRINLYL